MTRPALGWVEAKAEDCPYPGAVAALPEALALAAARGRARAVVYTPPPHLSLGPRDRRLPALAEAAAWARRQGYPVAFRQTGGSAVLLDDGCLAWVASWPGSDFTAWRRHFTWVGEAVAAGLAALGVAAGFGQAAQAFCPGPYDLVSRAPATAGRKLAGLAQAVRGGAVTVGGVLALSQDPAAATALIAEFYRRAGSPRPLDPDAATNLAEVAGIRRPEAVLAALRTGFAGRFRLGPDRLEAADWEMARSLALGQGLP